MIFPSSSAKVDICSETLQVERNAESPDLYRFSKHYDAVMAQGLPEEPHLISRAWSVSVSPESSHSNAPIAYLLRL